MIEQLTSVRAARALASLVVVVLCAALAAAGPPQRTSAAVAVVRQFYTYHLRDGGAFTPANVAERRRWLTAELYGLIQHEFEREAEFRRANPDEVPYYNGDPFTNSQEYPTRFHTGRVRTVEGQAEVEITFSFGAVQRVNRVRLGFERGSWRIADVVDEDGKSFLEELRRPVYNP